MKKMMISAILLMSCVAFTNAQSAPVLQDRAAVVMNQDGYKEVALADLSEQLQSAVNALAGETSEIKKLESNEEKGFTRVTLVNKESKEEKTVILDKEGKEVK